MLDVQPEGSSYNVESSVFVFWFYLRQQAENPFTTSKEPQRTDQPAGFALQMPKIDILSVANPMRPQVKKESSIPTVPPPPPPAPPEPKTPHAQHQGEAGESTSMYQVGTAAEVARASLDGSSDDPATLLAAMQQLAQERLEICQEMKEINTQLGDQVRKLGTMHEELMEEQGRCVGRGAGAFVGGMIVGMALFLVVERWMGCSSK
ncbi:hypothetical protein CLAFUW4_11459 [Fulvia fulva]|uniref:Uncharacterized protein n=1 Tax=Passalora fulva TaxID=5499 RepID=A0A9Q8PC35_PASFU|nr:uncharacterized protein CLAFUR5_10502 [Fulvia fulva]KAK4619508.1 hypothetical protein CLAFUR4_11465 [Fulvia fulva]KAK4620903.1 hypothetical protein CLAFUR0_11473 [Fulvia fulva]UJO19729.1 hypothetical protein CLAFUR5_10502 [Fulvia fulva]WPV16945.1 hypothetical protein CLAFUW4_11459 [Fulvia fulva]WPV31941.1 hypothetical protein CLAFUW7_11455 [Fulvia fulva]